MDAWDLLVHGANFLAPAWVLGLLLAGFGAMRRGTRPGLAWPAQALLNIAVGVAVLMAGLWWLGRDGKMLTYAALVLATALSQWAGSAGWRR